MMNTFMLRYIAERAATCGEALSIIQDCVKKGLVRRRRQHLHPLAFRG